MIYSLVEPASPDFRVATALHDELTCTVGSSAFPRSVTLALRRCAPVQEYMAFSRSDSATAPQILISEGEDGKASARAEAYRSRYFRYDPINRLLDDKTPAGTYVLRVRSQEIAHRDYRRLCYTRPGFSEKLAFAKKVRSSWVVLSLFRMDHSSGFDECEVHRLGQLGQFVMPILALHLRLAGGVARNTPLSIAEIEARLRVAFPRLSNRETSVCARSVVGVTAEGIAIDLGIKQTSVLTYRRRAYERLNINSVHQLSTMLLQ